MPNFVSAIIVAAGGSVRMGGNISKQFIPLLGRPAIEYTLKAFQSCDVINEIVIVCRRQDRQRIEYIVNENGFNKVTNLVEGGATRAQSVANGIGAVNENSEYLAIHDGARPLITAKEIELVTKNAFETKAATLGVSVKDTIKIVDKNNIIENTPPRSQLRAVQTPQVFERKLYQLALGSAGKNTENLTDDCALIENMGCEVEVVKGCEENIKLTTPIDVMIAEGILKARNNICE